MQVSQAHLVRQYLIQLQADITTALHELDGTAFVVDVWKKPEGEMLQGDGITQILKVALCLKEQGVAFRM